MPSVDPEEDALRQGFDLRAMTAPEDHVPGMEEEGGHFSREGGEIGFAGQFGTDQASVPVGSSLIVSDQATGKLLRTPLDAQGPVSLLKGVEPEAFAGLFASGLSQSLGARADQDAVEAERLAIAELGDTAAAFAISFDQLTVRFRAHFVFVARGRVSAVLVVVGVDRLEQTDTAQLAAALDARIQRFSPSLEVASAARRAHRARGRQPGRPWRRVRALLIAATWRD